MMSDAVGEQARRVMYAEPSFREAPPHSVLTLVLLTVTLRRLVEGVAIKSKEQSLKDELKAFDRTHRDLVRVRNVIEHIDEVARGATKRQRDRELFEGFEDRGTLALGSIDEPPGWHVSILNPANQQLWTVDATGAANDLLNLSVRASQIALYGVPGGLPRSRDSTASAAERRPE